MREYGDREGGLGVDMAVDERGNESRDDVNHR